MDVLLDGLPHDTLDALEEVLRDSREFVVTSLTRIQGEAFHGSLVDECVHFFTSGQSWHSWKNSHELQANEGVGTKSSRSTPST